MADNASWTPDFGTLDAAPPEWSPKRPLRVVLMGDFSAAALNGRCGDAAAIAARKPVPVEFDTLEDAMARMELSLTLPIGADALGVPIALQDLEGFHPDTLYGAVDMFGALAALRKRLNNPSTFAAAAAEVRGWGTVAQPRASQVAARSRSRGATLAADARLDAFAALLERDAGGARASGPIDQLLRNVVGPLVRPADNPDKAALLAVVDEALSDAMRAILHHADFQNVEALWRGADFLLRRIETGPRLQVSVLDLSAEELAADLSRGDDLAESGLYRLLVERPAEDADGGYTYLVGCYRFAATPPQFELLGRMAKIAAHAGATFLSGIDTDAFTNRKEPPHPLVRSTLQALRALPQAACLALAGPRFLLRYPYGKRTDPISSFGFEEFQRSAGLRGMLWGHPALLLATVLCQRGTPTTVDDLPFHTFVDDDGDRVPLPCTERLIGTAAATLLRDHGINGLMAHKGEPRVRFSGVETVNGQAVSAAPPLARAVLLAAIATIGAGDERVASDAPRGDAADEPSAAADDGAEAPAETSAEASAGASEAPAVAAAVDDELDALLAELGGDTATGEAAAGAAVAAEAPGGDGEPEMDPELAALLKELG